MGQRFLAVADSFNAMTSPIPYHDPLPLDEALSDLEKRAGVQFDPDVVRAFIHAAQNHQEDWPLGCQLQLTNPARQGVLPK